MSTRTKTTKKTTSETTSTIKFTKGAFYQDRNDRLWCCANARTKKAQDGVVVVQMQQTEDGQAVGDPVEEPADGFVKQLTAAELKEYQAVCQRELEAEAETNATPLPAKKTKPAKDTTESKARKSKPASDQPKKVSALDAAAKVLGESSEPMATKVMIEAMSAKGYWTSPGGQTPHATLYAAILREITVKGAESRFAKTDKGRFALASK